MTAMLRGACRDVFNLETFSGGVMLERFSKEIMVGSLINMNRTDFDVPFAVIHPGCEFS